MGIKVKKYIAKWLLNLVQLADRESSEGKCISNGNVVSARDECVKSNRLESRAMTLRIFPGLGGLAIETYSYDPKTGDGTTVLHIVPDGEELSDALSKIVTIDTMRMR